MFLLLGMTLTLNESNILSDYLIEYPNTIIYTPDEQLYNNLIKLFPNACVEKVYYNGYFITWDAYKVPLKEFILLSSGYNSNYKFRAALPSIVKYYSQASLEDYSLI